MIRMKDQKPERGGLFDEKITGGMSGQNWSHIRLAAPMPNPVFERAIMALSGIRAPQYASLISGEHGVTKDGQIVTTPGDPSALYGPASLERLLGKIDVKRELEQDKARLGRLSGQVLNETRRRVKYLQALDKLQMSPTDAYMMRHVPVLPPSMRPLAVTDDGRIQTDDLNELYKGLALVNMKVGQFPAGTPRSLIAPVEADIYDHLKALSGLGGTLNDRFTGIIQTLSGTGRGGPKKSYVQDVLFKRKQDLTMRSTIVPNPGLSLDEVELPRKAAKEMYKPFVVRDLRRTAGVGPLEAKKMIDEDDPLAQRALDRVVQERPVMLKRDPALHKWSVQAFTPRLTESKTIGIHPLVCSGYNADFDGNCLHGGSKIVLIFPPEAGITTSEGEVVMKFAGETRVFSSDGQVIVEMEIRDVPRSDKPIAHDRNGNPVYGLPPGTLVLSYDHARHQPLFTEATGLTIEQACETVQVRGRSCEVVASSNESLCLYDHETGEVRKCSPLGSEGRLMPVVRRIPLVSAGEHDFYYGWMIGAFASDGFFMGDREHIIGYSKVSSAHRDRFFAALRQHEPGQLRRATYATTHGPDDDVEGESVKDHIVGIDLLLSVFKDCYHPSLRVKKPGERAALYKKLPADLGAYSLDALHGVLSGLLDGDGHVSKDVKGRVIIQIGTSSPYLVASVEVLCSLLGIRCGVTSVEPVAGRVQKHTAYIITLSRIDVEAHVFDIDLVGDGDTILQEMRLSRWAGATFKDDRDVVPIPFKILEFLASTRGPAERGLQRVLATTKSKTRRGPYTSRATARRMLGYLPESFEGRAQWEALVTTTDVHWDVIQSVEDYGTIEVFDLIVPETKVFVANGGLVVWDTMSAYVPISNEAVREAQSMFPSRNLFNAATHRVMYTPDKEMQVGLYMASEIGKRTNKSFKSEAELDRALAKDEVGPNDVVTVPGPGGKPIRTTASRLKIGQHLPDQLRDQVLTNLDLRLTKKEQGRLFQQMAEVEGDRYPERINGLKNVGNETVTMGGFTIGLEDLRPLKELREPLLRAAKAKASKLDLRKPADAQRYVDIYADAAEVLDKKLDQAARDPSNKSQLARLQVAAGIKGGGFKQLVGAPVLFVDGKGEVVPNAVTTSYSEGLRTLPYWSATSGGRKGIVQKVQSVREPGYLTKLMTNSTLNQIVDTDDCETSRGIALRIDDPDVLGRYTTASLKLGHGKEIPAGTLLTDDILSRIRNNDPRAKVVVRSPMRCDHTTGVCARCMGLNENGRLHDLGTNVGVLASQALGERGTQLALRSFHCSHAKTLVTVRNHEQQRPLTVSLEHLFDIVGGEIIEEEGSELRICDPDQGWLIYQGSGADHAWTELLQVRRHAPTRPMKMLSDMSGVLICQDNHPVPARPNLVRCERCGYHRLKKPSPRAMHTSGKWYCPKCHRYQHPAPERWGEQDFLPAAALESKRFYVERDLLPPHGTGASFWMDPYRAGAYVAEAFPSDFLSYSDSDLALALCGLIDGDGTSKDIDRADRIAIDTTSFELAQQIVMICARLGIVANLVATKVRSLTRNQGFRVVLRITLRAQSLLAASLKLRRVKVPSPAQEPELTGPHLLTTVRDVLYTDSYVYDVTTASGVFVGGGLLNHNSGGVFEGREATSKSLMAGGLDRALGLLYLTQNVKGSTTLATRNGEVESVKKDPAGGWDVRIGGQRHYVSSDVQVSVKPGDKVRRGDALATGYVNPHHLLPLAGLDRTQGYLAQQLHGIYSQEGIRRRNSELMVRAISGVTQIEDPGDHPTLLRGDMASTPGVAKWNRDTAKAGKQPVRHSPVLRGVKLLPLDMQEDWMARLNHERLKGTLLEAAQQGWTAQMHGPHPIPPLLQGAEFGKGTKEKPWQY
jgi:intein/homing endonuclease